MIAIFRFSLRHLALFSACTALAVASAGCGGGSSSLSTSPQTIGGLNTIATLSSTVDVANGDNNPYPIAIAPPKSTTFPGDGVSGHIQPGDVVVGNFSNSAGTQGAGTTYEDVSTGKPVNVFTEPAGTAGGPAAFAFNTGAGYLWTANAGLLNSASPGNVQIVSPSGALVNTLTAPAIQYGWGQAYNNDFGGKGAFFSVNLSTGTILRINVVAGAGGVTFTYDTLASGLAATLSGFGGTGVGPAGMVDTSTDTLYVVDSDNNTIYSISNASTVAAATGLTNAKVVYSDPNGTYLSQPVGLALNPINGDLITCNQKNNNLVEINPNTGKVVAVKTVDPAVVQSNGTGSALFGVAATTDSSGNLKVYFTDDNTNTVNTLSK